MSYSNLQKAYEEFRWTMRSLPLGEKRKQVKKEMSDFLEKVRDEHGQETVWKLTKQNGYE